jgi:formylglycine-generating enzyme required for sulfatase activity
MAGEAIFVGYRRDDTADVAGRIYDAMAQRFGKQRVFKDVDNIGPGVDFGDYIKTVLPRCRVALVLIGPHWLESKDETGKRRLDDDHDWVRIEIETALATPGVLVVPVLVNGARMPRGEEVPDSLKALLRRNAAIIRRDPDFHDDVERLATAIRSSVNSGIIDLSKIGGKSAGPAPAPSRERTNRAPLLIGGAIAAALALVAVGFGVSRWLPAQGSETVEEQTATVESAPQDGTEAQQLQTQPAPAQQPSAAPPTQSATTTPLAPTRAEEPAPTPAAPDPSTPAAPYVPPLPDMVRIPGHNFEAGRYEVTFAEWDACVADGGCNGYRPPDQGWGRGRRPVINVNWNDAQAYLQWLNQRSGRRYRLLAESEWEIAARAGTTTEYSWGDQDPVCDQNVRNGANFIECTDDRTRPVGSFQPNGFGLYDVHGNVWEWVQDSDGSLRVLRGGSWYDGPQYLRSADRGWSDPSNRYDNWGFRLARTL